MVIVLAVVALEVVVDEMLVLEDVTAKGEMRRIRCFFSLWEEGATGQCNANIHMFEAWVVVGTEPFRFVKLLNLRLT